MQKIGERQKLSSRLRFSVMTVLKHQCEIRLPMTRRVFSKPRSAFLANIGHNNKLVICPFLSRTLHFRLAFWAFCHVNQTPLLSYPSISTRLNLFTSSDNSVYSWSLAFASTTFVRTFFAIDCCSFRSLGYSTSKSAMLG